LRRLAARFGACHGWMRRRSLSIPRLRLVLAVVVAVLVPSASRVFGNGSLAFTMFSRSETYRLRVTTTDARGTARRVAPTAVAAAIGGTPGDILAGTEQWRHGPFGSLLADHLGEVARFACRLGAESARAEVVLERRQTLDAPVELVTASARCP
jgi:hypothetical protein